MTAVVAEVTPPVSGHDEGGCLICATTRTPMSAYRPHTLDGECWCLRNADGEKMSHRSMCWVYTTYLAWSPG